MAATGTALIASQPGSSYATAYPQPTGAGVGGQNLDLIQIVGLGGNVILNVNSSGTVNKPASGATNGTRVGQYQSTLTSGSSVAAIFANAFANPSNLDILQVVSPTGGSVVKYIDYLGVSH